MVIVVDMDIMVDYHDSTSVAQKLKLIRRTSDPKLSLVVFEHDKDEGPLFSGGTVVKFGPA